MILINFLVHFILVLLRKYAWAVELDGAKLSWMLMILGSMITYEEVDVDEDELTGRRRSSKKNKGIIFTFILFYTFCTIDCHFCDLLCLELSPDSTGRRSSASSYSVVQAISSISSVTPSSSSSSSSSSSNIEPAISVSGEGKSSRSCL